ncbi:pyridine nucleotide-disulfide oxidoreductase [Hydrogenispora ethanolica]|uniref:Pyridine nucleotide-disulfide oxidoreductase n=1 Tax=Hydrogenispora ethanolica TaxID=1082276 RepID=A0A4R1S758_HYDET|nr:FAD-dependent oxidoreductase [Hydrogenispora ethanolica]TCL75223.1 pyridine nucleotide-disulfide oxidoreductase [Hydrogenispora ethanolica]
MKYVIIGASAAGINAAQTIRKLDSQNEILLISKDDRVYSRCMLHHVIAGKRSLDGISFVSPDFFTQNALQWIKGTGVRDIRFAERRITLEDDQSVAYDRLLIASGASASLPPIKGLAGAPNVFTLRDISDVQRIGAAAQAGKTALVIGAGLVGMDAAAGLLEKGLHVVIVEQADRLLPLQLDRTAASNYQTLFEQAGAEVYTGVTITEALPSGNGGPVQSVRLNDGTVIPCDLVIAATGVRPNTGFIKDAVLTMNDGITVDEQMQTSLPDVYAAGDVTGRSAIWPLAVKQGIVAGSNMAGTSKKLTDGFTAKNSINLLGLETVSLGLVHAPDPSYEQATLNHHGVYKKIIYKDGVVHGVILQKEISRCGFWTQVIKEKLPIEPWPADIFDLNYAAFYQIAPNGRYQYARAL